MDKSSVASFFNEQASVWDDEMIRNDKVISEILDCAGVREGKSVLDVACGTGVLFNDYLSRGVSSVTAIDISAEMVRIAREKFPQVKIYCGDAEDFNFDDNFDCIVIYNAFPHFIDEKALFKNLSKHLADSGRITVAHGMSREDILKCHSGKANSISKELPQAEELAKTLNDFVNVDVVISDSSMYVISGSKNNS